MRQADLSEFQPLCDHPMRVVWAVSQVGDRRSICPLGWKMYTSMTPPMMAIAVAPKRFTHTLIMESGELVLAWPGEDLAQATLICGTNSGRDMDKFAEANLTPLPGRYLKTPIIKECIANLECRVTGHLTTGDHTLFAAEIHAVWVSEEPKKPLCLIGAEEGYQLVLDQPPYRFGVVK
ncbi:MAG: flavin reductase family protein [Armatimonadota bacterium]